MFLVMDYARAVPFWAMLPAEALSAIGAFDSGLGGAQAAARLERFGLNRTSLP